MESSEFSQQKGKRNTRKKEGGGKLAKTEVSHGVGVGGGVTLSFYPTTSPVNNRGKGLSKAILLGDWRVLTFPNSLREIICFLPKDLDIREVQDTCQTSAYCPLWGMSLPCFHPYGYSSLHRMSSPPASPTGLCYPPPPPPADRVNWSRRECLEKTATVLLQEI